MHDLSDWTVASWTRERSRKLWLFALLSAFLMESDAFWSRTEQPETEAEGTSDPEAFIKRGARIDIARHPYLLSLRDPGTSEHKCAAFLISPAVALTAAHCLKEHPDLVPHLAKPCPPGNHLCQQTVGEHFESVEVDRTLQHPEFTGTAHEGADLAIIVLKAPLEGHPTLAVLPQPEPSGWNDDMPFFAMGWGIVSDDQEPSDALQGVVLFYQNVESCYRKYINANYGRIITPDMICAGQDGKGTCHGDSGGPLIIMGRSWEEDLAVGIVSFGGEKCGKKDGVPSVFTRLKSFIEDLEYALTLSPPPMPPAPVQGPPQGPENVAQGMRKGIRGRPVPGEISRANHTFTGLSDCPAVYASVEVELTDMTYYDERENIRARLSGRGEELVEWSACRFNSLVKGKTCGEWAYLMCGEDVSGLVGESGELTVEVMGSKFVATPCEDNVVLNALVTVHCGRPAAPVCEGNAERLEATSSSHCPSEESLRPPLSPPPPPMPPPSTSPPPPPMPPPPPRPARAPAAPASPLPIASELAQLLKISVSTAEKLLPKKQGGTWAFSSALNELSLYNNDFGAEGAKALAAALKPRENPDGTWAFNTALNELYLAHNAIGDEGAKALAAALEPRENPDGTWAFNTGLNELSLWNSAIGAEGAKALAAALEPRENPDGTWAFNTALNELYLRYNAIGAEGAKALAAALEPRENPDGTWAFSSALNVLSLWNSGIRDEGAKALAAALEPRENPDGTWAFSSALNELYLGYNAIGAEGAEALAAALEPRENPDGTWAFSSALNVLSLLSNRIGDEGAKALAAALKPRENPDGTWAFNTALNVLYLAHDSISDAAKRALRDSRDAINSRRTGTKLIVSGV